MEEEKLLEIFNSVRETMNIPEGDFEKFKNTLNHPEGGPLLHKKLNESFNGSFGEYNQFQEALKKKESFDFLGTENLVENLSKLSQTGETPKSQLTQEEKKRITDAIPKGTKFLLGSKGERRRITSDLIGVTRDQPGSEEALRQHENQERKDLAVAGHDRLVKQFERGQLVDDLTKFDFDKKAPLKRKDADTEILADAAMAGYNTLSDDEQKMYSLQKDFDEATAKGEYQRANQIKEELINTNILYTDPKTGERFDQPKTPEQQTYVDTVNSEMEVLAKSDKDQVKDAFMNSYFRTKEINARIEEEAVKTSESRKGVFTREGFPVGDILESPSSKRLQELKVEEQAKFEAASKIYLGNVDPASVQKDLGFTLASFGKSALKGLLPDKLAEKLPKSEREILDATQQLMSEEGIAPSEKQIDKFDRTLGEKVTEFTGGIAGILPALFLSGQVVKAARVGIGLNNIVKVWQTGSKLQRLGAVAVDVIAEEAKTIIAGLPPGAGIGFGLAAAPGKLKLLGAAKKAGLTFEQMMAVAPPKTGVLNALWNTTKGAGGATVAMNTAKGTEALVKALSDNRKFKEELEKVFGDLSEEGAVKDLIEDIGAEYIGNLLFASTNTGFNKGLNKIGEIKNEKTRVEVKKAFDDLINEKEIEEPQKRFEELAKTQVKLEQLKEKGVDVEKLTVEELEAKYKELGLKEPEIKEPIKPIKEPAITGKEKPVEKEVVKKDEEVLPVKEEKEPIEKVPITEVKEILPTKEEAVKEIAEFDKLKQEGLEKISKIKDIEERVKTQEAFDKLIEDPVNKDKITELLKFDETKGESEDIFTEGEKLRRGVEKPPKGKDLGGVFQAKGTPAQKEVSTIVNEKPSFYNKKNFTKGFQEGQDYIVERGGIEASHSDLLKSPKMENADQVVMARTLAMDFHTKKSLDKTLPEVQRQAAFRKVSELISVVGRDSEFAGRSIAYLKAWKAMGADGSLEFIVRKRKQNNEEILGVKKGGVSPEETLSEFETTISKGTERLIKEIENNPDIRKQIERLLNKPSDVRIKTSFKERAKREKTRRKDINKKFKKSDFQIMSSGIGNPKLIEYAGEMAASYVREGVYNAADIIQRIQKDLKDVFNVKLEKDEIKRSIGNIDELTAKEISKSARLKQTKKFKDTSIAKKESETNIGDIIRGHFTGRNKFSKSLVDKLIEDAGLTEAEAKRLGGDILKSVEGDIKALADEALTKSLGTSTLPRPKKKKKDFADALIENINMGALDTEFNRKLFSEKFGLLPELTPDQAGKIKELADVVQTTEGSGTIAQQAMIDFARYTTELLPESASTKWARLWVEINYAQMLSGLSTSALNLMSGSSNIFAKFVRDPVNLSKWFRAIKSGKKEDFVAYNPIAELILAPSAALKGVSSGWTEAKNVWETGILDNKYIEQIMTASEFKLQELERHKYGKHRFKGKDIKVGSKTISTNPANYLKYVARMLSAQDKLMHNTVYEMQIMSIIREKLAKQGLSGKELRQAVMDQFFTGKINEVELEARLTKEFEAYEAGGNKLSQNQKNMRRREIIFEEADVTIEEREIADQMARSSIFTDKRTGLIGRMAAGIAKIANKNAATKVAIMPFVPFTRVVGNVTEYMLDHMPIYGMFRAHGYSPTGMIQRFRQGTFRKPSIQAEGSSQMGGVGTRQYYEQMGRAWLGNTSMALATGVLLDDDKNGEPKITGSLQGSPNYGQGEKNVYPAYSFKFLGHWIPYLNIPSIAIPFAWIGNIKDRLRKGEKMETVLDYARVAALSGLNSVLVAKDMSFVEGISDFTKMISEAASFSPEDKEAPLLSAGKVVAREVVDKYMGFAARPLPWNNNMLRQINKMVDPTSYSKRSLKDVLNYSLGVHSIFNEPNRDVFGDIVKTWPGETLIPYTHWFKLKGEDPRWKFLVKYNSIPNKITNSKFRVVNGLEKRPLEPEEMNEYVKKAGFRFSKYLQKYMSENTTKNLDVKAKSITDGKSKVQKEIAKILDKARRETREEIFNEAKLSDVKKWQEEQKKKRKKD